MEKHVIEWTALAHRCAYHYHTGLSTQVHRLLLQEPLDRMFELLDKMRREKKVNLYYCGPTRALWAIQGVSSMGFTSFGSLHSFSWEDARAEAVRQATIWPDMASNGINPATPEEMERTLNNLGIPKNKRATQRMTDATCVYCA
jgi:hypothetical protein